MKFGVLLKDGTISLIHWASKLFGLLIVCCANIAEGRSRYNNQDNRCFVKIARGSLYETISWLRLAYARQLLTNEQVSRFQPILDELLPKLNVYLKSIGNRE
ncbi:four helix bundle protein [uncultured Nostoc sp.]|uniref:four helix bundle protein n=1 Tax=uncultured Nostoc sp. TaxID=340711 RepID=UPI0035CAF77B